jgi:hypothetical protein
MKISSWKTLLLLLASVMATSTLNAQQPEDIAAAKQQYEEMKAQVSGGDLKLDWRAFRVAAVTGGLTAGFASRADYNQAVGDTEGGKLDAALSAANAAIDRNMADPEAHLLAARVFEKMGRKSDAEREQTIEGALVKSIFDSGDGKSAATAWFVVTTAEENFFIKTSLGEQPTAHVPSSQSGQTLDKVTAVDWANVSHDTWFTRPTGAAPVPDEKKE